MKNTSQKSSFMTHAAMIAAIYVVLTYIFAPFSFGDVQHELEIALVYRSRMSTNPFFISNGFKLNMQKRFIVVVSR